MDFIMVKNSNNNLFIVFLSSSLFKMFLLKKIVKLLFQLRKEGRKCFI